MEEIRLGPIEWGVVTAHYRWGLGVRLEESGDEGVIVLSSIHDDFLRCNGEYWPEIGERIRVRRYLYRSPNDEVRLTSRAVRHISRTGSGTSCIRVPEGSTSSSRPRTASARGR